MKIIYKQSQIDKIANKSLFLIKKRILDGIDKTDTPFKPYSKNAFAMPIGSTTKGAVKKLGDGIKYFRTKTGTWIVVLGGYEALKKARSPEWDGKVNLTITGAMLRSMAITKQGQNSYTIGFTRAEEAQKMFWQIAKGRDGMGLSPNDLKELTPLLNEGFDIIE